MPGRKVVYSGDTSACDAMVENSRDADLLIHEATCTHDMIEDREGHTSAKQAAEIAKRADVKQLVLTHISRRFLGREDELLDEASELFEDSVLAEDGLEFEIRPHRPES